MIRFLVWFPWRRRNLPAQIRYLGPPHTVHLMNAIGDVLDPTVPKDDTERGQLLAQAGELLMQVARMDAETCRLAGVGRPDAEPTMNGRFSYKSGR